MLALPRPFFEQGDVAMMNKSNSDEYGSKWKDSSDE